MKRKFVNSIIVMIACCSLVGCKFMSWLTDVRIDLNEMINNGEEII